MEHKLFDYFVKKQRKTKETFQNFENPVRGQLHFDTVIGNARAFGAR